MGLDARFRHPVHVQAVLEKTGHQIHLRINLQTIAQFTCDRCLDEFERPMSSNYEIVYTSEQAAASAGHDEEMQFLSPDTNVLDLGEDVRQFLILAVPQKVLCNDNCLGLCPKCGANRNKGGCNCSPEERDPRWDGLKKVSLN